MPPERRRLREHTLILASLILLLLVIAVALSSVAMLAPRRAMPTPTSSPLHPLWSAASLPTIMPLRATGDRWSPVPLVDGRPACYAGKRES